MHLYCNLIRFISNSYVYNLLYVTGNILDRYFLLNFITFIVCNSTVIRRTARSVFLNTATAHIPTTAQSNGKYTVWSPDKIHHF